MIWLVLLLLLLGQVSKCRNYIKVTTEDIEFSDLSEFHQREEKIPDDKRIYKKINNEKFCVGI